MLYDKWNCQHDSECVQMRPNKSVLCLAAVSCVMCRASLLSVLAVVTKLSVPPYYSAWNGLWSATCHNIPASIQRWIQSVLCSILFCMDWIKDN